MIQLSGFSHETESQGKKKPLYLKKGTDEVFSDMPKL